VRQISATHLQKWCALTSSPPSAPPNAYAVPLRSSFFRLLTWFFSLEQ
jgi:hypothetical protein